MRRLRILLVEDDVVQSLLLAELLAVLGYDVCGTAETEAEAVAAALRTNPDMMLVDANLKSGSGVSAMRTILQRTAMPHIYTTGGGAAAVPAKATVLQKPFGMAALKGALSRVADQIEQQRASSANAQT